MRESTVEKYLHDQVELAGGTTRKFSSVHRPNNPDRIVIWKRVDLVTPLSVRYKAEIHFVETKAPRKKPRAGQVREHKRLLKLGCVVLVLDTKAKVDVYVECNR